MAQGTWACSAPTAGCRWRCGASAAITTLGVVFGWWLAGMGVVLLVLSIMGFVFEYYRGDHAH